MNNIYKAPESDLSQNLPDNYGDIEVFERFSTWYVVGLSIITLSLYIPYWFYTRSKCLNKVAYHQMSYGFMWTVVILYLITFVIGFAPIIFVGLEPYIGESNPNMKMFPLVDLTANILVIVWAFKFRNRLHETFSSEGFGIGIILTFFFQNMYLQYKLNELIDRQQHIKQRNTDSGAIAPPPVR